MVVVWPAGASLLAGQESRSSTPEVFRRYADRVVKIEVVETGSSAKAVAGSGFFVSGDGRLVTNYHVIADLVHEPARYQAELTDAAGIEQPLTILAIDVVHDLAVLSAETEAAEFFRLGRVTLAQGRRLYSLGHPADLGMSIVEGTYNGSLPHTLYERIHFTGSLNPGMSGGPTIAESGAVVGINVSTAGNQLSFLVPVGRAAALVEQTLAPGFRPPEDFLAEAGRQILEYQDAYLADVLADSLPTVTLGPYDLPTRPAPFFHCWADADRDEEDPYERVDHECSTNDYIFISRGHASGILELRHRLLTTTELNPIRFYALYAEQFAGSGGWMGGREQDVTRFRCETRNIRHEGLAMRAVFCVRRYKKLGPLYDVVLRAATLGRRDAGVLTTLTLAGVSFENAERFVRRYLERIR